MRKRLDDIVADRVEKFNQLQQSAYNEGYKQAEKDMLKKLKKDKK